MDGPSDFGSSEAGTAAFVETVQHYYREYGRDLPWRRTYDPYEILVSEVMLQQTQVARVLVKYPEFLARFPDPAALAVAQLADVLAAWSGLGYNRRALSLQRAATMMVEQYGNRVPASFEALRRLPGVGPATAAAVCAFAFGRPQAFIETNIRAAFIHYFFPGRESVADSEILPLIERTMDRDNPRQWFYALMDYGVWVKRMFGNPNRRSKHHALQTPFYGSRRELRAQVLNALLLVTPSAIAPEELRSRLPGPPRALDELLSVLDELAGEGFLTRERCGYRVA
jgi:A/G-specific adenine glycosylase